jgi:hypothetical protein
MHANYHDEGKDQLEEKQEEEKEKQNKKQQQGFLIIISIIATGHAVCGYRLEYNGFR